MVWHDAFPRLMFNLIFHDNIQPSTDNRMMDEPQAMPVFASNPGKFVKEKFTENTDLSQAFWFASLLIFFLERFISFKTKMQKANA